MQSSIQDEKISKLGFGCMRLPRKAGAFDMEQICKMVDAFIESGGSYFDTAYVYDGSEAAMGESLVKRYPRDKFQIATKLNLRIIQSAEEMAKQFKTSCERLRTDHIDFYLLHGINASAEEKAEKLGAWDYLKELKAKGLIGHMGFSFHGKPSELEEILSAHPEAEFVQLQINYFDWDNPKVESRRMYEIARKFDTPIIIMEPVKGGMLASEGSPTAGLLREAAPGVSMASWGFRFVSQLPGVFVTLSGMSALSQVADNVAIFKDMRLLSDDEKAILDKAVGIINSVPRIDCTGCGYCLEGCPSNIKIPNLLEIYNSYLTYNTTTNLDFQYKMWAAQGGKAGDCTNCKACEEACPQKLEIPDSLSKISALFD